MNSIFLLIFLIAGYLIAYHTYGKFIARRIFKIDPKRVCPSWEFRDNHDFVPTNRHILFGHHFTSIAGLGPIVGPAIGIIWGWIPAVLWIFFGSIFMGAVHDFGTLVISLRSQGRSIGDLTADIISKRVRILFLLIIFFELWVLIAIFALIVALLFLDFPIAVIPVWSQAIIAICMGYLIYRKRIPHLWPSIVSVIIMYGTIIIGAYFPIDLSNFFDYETALIVWIVMVLILNAWLASSLPVHVLLQPRDYINSHQLIIAMGLLTLGAIVSHPPIVAPLLDIDVKGAPPIFPFLFVVIACGAISGFHSLVSSGTSSKQCDSEESALFIGYGSMLMESVLSAIVIISVAAGIGLGLRGEGGKIFVGKEAFLQHYYSWQAANGLADKIGAFIQGSANMMQAIGIPPYIALAIMAVFIVSFAATTLDSATRIQRYVIVELANAIDMELFKERHRATLLAVGSAGALAFYNGSGKGAMKLWPLFGSVNQLLAGLALLVITIYLTKKRSRIMYTALPMVFMIIMTGWSILMKISFSFRSHNWLLFGIGLAVFLLEIWMIAESIRVLFPGNLRNRLNKHEELRF